MNSSSCDPYIHTELNPPIRLQLNQLRPKAAEAVERFLALSPHYRIAIALYHRGNCYLLGGEDPQEVYDIGSVSKTFTAHLILWLEQCGKLDIHQRVDAYLPLKKGNYPTLYQLMTHTAGYHHLTPLEITLPPLLTHGYARKNPYERCSAQSVLGCLERRRFWRPKVRYGYSDFGPAILSLVAEAVTQTPFDTLMEDFIQNVFGLKETLPARQTQERTPPAVKGRRFLPFWIWKKGNPYTAAGGISCTIGDLLKYLALQIESEQPYIASAHAICPQSKPREANRLTCIGWHTYKNSNQLWHVGGVSTFRTSILFNKKRRFGVAVLGNARGGKSANIDYIAKTLYGELKRNHIH